MLLKIWINFLFFSLLRGCDPTICSCSGDNCISCVSPFTYLAQNTCMQCPPQCSSCASSYQCTSCRPSYYLETGICLLCPKNCQVCSSTICLYCTSGFALEDNKCVSCSDPNALSCQTQASISSCRQGYWQNGNSCSPCRQFCLLCSSSSNCLKCQDGFYVSVSFGSYCSSCSSGCKTCTSTSCSSCFYNFRLEGGQCMSIRSQCNSIPNCKECYQMNNMITCHACEYPYYLSFNSCIIGSSMLCQNGSIGPLYTNCINLCEKFSYQVDTYQQGNICQLLPWINSNPQTYLNPFSTLFTNYQYINDNEVLAYDSSLTNGQSLTFNLTFSPYYKIDMYFKLVIIAQQQPQTKISIILSDNQSNSETHSFNINITQPYTYAYLSLTTKNIKDQLVSIMISSNSTSIIGLSQMISQVYSCPDNCRTCYNKELCIQCFSQYFVTPEYSCVQACNGYIELYLPDGNPNSFSSKACVLQCPNLFYTRQNGSEYRCAQCEGNCVSCLSKYECLSCVSSLLYYEINYTCLIICPITHFNVSSVCTPCNAPCETCIDQTTCLSCSVGYFSQNKCISICPFGTYQNNFNNTCSPCDYNCLSCVGSSSFCLVCDIDFLLLQSRCVGNCTSNLYYEQNGICKPCIAPCKQCLSSTSCLSCMLGFLFGNQCLAGCPSLYYADSFNSLCKPCSINCQNCLSLLICLSCSPDKSLYSYTCYDRCPGGTYSASGICFNCLLPCQNCLSQTYCLSCSIGYLSLILPGTCLSECEQGFYGFDLNKTCLNCTNNCLSCTGASYLCSSCQPGFLLQGTSCIENCSSGLFNLSGVCYSCSYPCLTCTDSDYNCTSCYESYILLENSCETQCPLYTYYDGATCLPCEPPCVTCTAKTNCLSCIYNPSNQTYYINEMCLSSCPATTFPDDTSFTCRACLYPCKTCISEEKCRSCSTGYLERQLGTCSMCLATHFANQTSKQCQQCSLYLQFCQICLSSQECNQCQTGHYLLNGTCISETQCMNLTTFYLSFAFGSCLQCVSPCFSCITEEYCTSCVTGYLIDGQCISICPSSYYEQNGVCLKCQFPCMTCDGQSSCLSCNTSSQYSVQFPVNKTCIKQEDCPLGYYIEKIISDKQCVKCNLPCLTCINASFCLSCYSGILLEGTCKPFCPNSYFANTINMSFTVCSLCSSQCYKCDYFSFYCTSCHQGFYLRNNTCVSDCGPTFYLDMTVLQCFSCIPPCYNCLSASQCLDCINSTYILYFGDCISSCPDGSYALNGKCLDCPNSCLSCILADNNISIICTSCASGLFMSSTTLGQCVGNCSITQYGDIYTRNCYRCIPPCLSCIDAIKCTTCQPFYLWYDYECLKIDRCPQGSYLLGQRCIKDCGLLWAFPTSSLCTQQCKPLFLKTIMKNSQLHCLNSCPQSYSVVANYSCASCSSILCENLLQVKLSAKNIFNALFLKLTFNRQINTKVITQSQLKLSLSSLVLSRLLQTTNYTFSFATRNLNAMWIKINLQQSLKNSQITITFTDYYLFNSPLQKLSYSTTITSFDYYSTQQQASTAIYQTFSETISSIMIILFLINLVFNSGYLSYSIIDYYQLMFMVLFLSIDYPPQLNHFLYGFRYSHFMFLPQIFRKNPEEEYSSQTPDKFGVIVPDVHFIKNTGHDFIIIFVTVGLLLLCKIIQKCFDKFACFRSNKVESEDGTQNKSQNTRLFVRFVKAVINRFKWNYFNDVIYCIYFSIMLFAFSQLFDLSSSSLASNLISIILAFFFLLLGISFPFFLAIFLRKNQKNLIVNSIEKEKQSYLSNKKKQQQKQQQQQQMSQHSSKAKKSQSQLQKTSPKEQQGASFQKNNPNQQSQDKNPFQILTDYKCFVSGVKLKVRLGFYNVPIRYIKKLILAALLVYCSQYPTFVLGVIMMLSFINILIAFALKPFRLTFQQIIYPLFDCVYLLIFFTILVLQLPLLQLSKQQKLAASYTTIVLSILLSLLLAIHNIIMNVLQIIRYFWKIDYLSKYYQSEYVSEEDSDKKTQQNSVVPVVKQISEDENPVIGQDIFSGLDIYLKKESTAPLYLIKCVKPTNEQQKRSQQGQQQSSQQYTQQQADKSDQKSIIKRISIDSYNSNRNIVEIQNLVKGIKPFTIALDQQESQY